MKKNKDLGILILRISIGVLMMLHGIAKIKNGVGGIEGMLANKGLPGFIAYGSYIGEVIAPLMMIIGFRARLASLFFALTCITAMYLAHAQDVFTLTKSGGWGVELLGLFLLGAVAIFFSGAGKYAVSTKSKWD